MRNFHARQEDGSFSIDFPDYIDARVLAAGANETYAIPTDAKYLLFSSTADFYAKRGGTAAVPAADVSDGTASELNPTVRYVGPGDTTVGLIAPADCVVTIAAYR